MEILHRELSKETERGREEKSKSTDLSNRSLKTDGETDSEAPTEGSLERERGREERSNLADAGWVLPEASVHKM